MPAPVISGLSVLTPSVSRWQLATAAFDLSGSYSDLFGFGAGAEIYADALVTGPNGEVYRQPCGPWQDYVVTGHASGHGEQKATSGSLHWRLNFAPTYEGTWHATITATNLAGSTTSSSFSWVCTTAISSLSALRIRNGFFTYSDGRFMAPIGHNYGFNDRDYNLDLSAGANDFMDRMGANGETLTRVWMSPYHRTDIDAWSNTGAQYQGFDNDYSGVRGDINLRAAWDMAYLLDRAGQNNVSCILVMQAHGPFSTVSDPRWSDNPYNSANGGPLTDPAQFFSNAAMINFTKRKYRYAQAMFFPRPAVGMIEYGNEMGSMGSSSTTSYANPGTRANWRTWIDTIGPFEKSIDYLRHLLGISQMWEPQAWGLRTTDQHFDAIARSPNVDVPQFHRYHWSDSTTNGDRGTSRQISLDMIENYGKPGLQGESGLYRNPAVPEASFNPATSGLSDAEISHLLVGTEVHNNQWESLVTPGCRWGGYWWWGSYLRDNSSQNRTSGTRHGIAWSFPLDTVIYPALAAFTAGEDPSNWAGGRVVDLKIETPATLIGYGFSNAERGWFWVRDELNRYDSGSLPGNMEPRTIGGNVTVFGFADGTYAIEVWLTYGAGGFLSTIVATSASGTLSFTPPAIDRDLAFKIHSTTLVAPPPPPPPPLPPPIPPVPGPASPPPRAGGVGSPVPSEIVIAYDGIDITRNVIYPSATFESQIQAIPGSFTVEVKDPMRTLGPFITGKELTVDIDGIRIYGGFLRQVRQGNFFPAVSTHDLTKVRTRKWTLTGVDYNLLMDKLVLRDINRPLQAIRNIPYPIYDGVIIRSFFWQVFDLPPGFTASDPSTVKNIHEYNDTANPGSAVWGWVQQGLYMRDQMNDFSEHAGAFYYWDAYKRLNFKSVHDLVAPFGFSDIPNGTSWIGFREGSAIEDATGQVNDAFVWGGGAFSNSGVGGVVYGRAQNPTSIAAHGRWQYAETHIGEKNYGSTAEAQGRANIIVSGTQEGTILTGGKGMEEPEKQFTLAWFSHDVPKDISGNRLHLVPGMVVTLNLWAFSEDGGATPFTLTLPLKSIRVTFPTLQDGTGRPYVRFDGFFGIAQSDPFWLWDFLLKQSTKRVTQGQLTPAVTTANNSTVDAPAPATKFTGSPNEATDGSRTIFHVKFPYISATLDVFINGLLERPRIDYLESDPLTGQFTMTSAPVSTDTLMVECKTL